MLYHAGRSSCTARRARAGAAASVAIAALAIGIGRGAAAADPPASPVPLALDVKGTGTIRLVVAEGTERPCESPDNHVLFQGHAQAGQTTIVKTAAGAVCIDHTYGTFRESQWAGAVWWSVGDRGPSPSDAAVLHIPVSTDEP